MTKSNLYACVLIGFFVSVIHGQTSRLAPETTPPKKIVVPQEKKESLLAGQTISTSDFDLEDRNRKNRIVPVRVYHDQGKEKRPVILFSHGLGGSRTNSPYLGNYWAKNGYIVVFMQHHGSDVDVINNARIGQKLRAIKSAASLESANARLGDVSFVLDQLAAWNKDKSHPLCDRFDLEHVGMTGHSFGAITTLTMAGQKFPLGRPTVDEPRIDAFLPMSPQPGKWMDPQKALSNLSRPVLCMTGTDDNSPVDRSVTGEKRQQVYRSLPAGDKYHLVLDGAEHHAFGDYESRFGRKRDPDHHGIIQTLSLKFWNAYLKEDAAAKTFLQSNSPESIKGFKQTDVFAWK